MRSKSKQQHSVIFLTFVPCCASYVQIKKCFIYIQAQAGNFQTTTTPSSTYSQYPSQYSYNQVTPAPAEPTYVQPAPVSTATQRGKKVFLFSKNHWV